MKFVKRSNLLLRSIQEAHLNCQRLQFIIYFQKIMRNRLLYVVTLLSARLDSTSASKLLEINPEKVGPMGSELWNQDLLINLNSAESSENAQKEAEKGRS